MHASLAHIEISQVEEKKKVNDTLHGEQIKYRENISPS